MRVMSLLGVVLLSCAAVAQEPAAIGTVRGDVHFHAAAEKMFLEYESSLTTKCTEIHPEWTQATHVVYGPTQVDAQENLLRATWAETVPGTACGQPRRFRALVSIRDGRAGVNRMLPGESNVSATLERDVRVALAGAVTVHAAKGTGCGEGAGLGPDVLDTNVVGHAVPAAGAAWSEVWLVSVCGRRMNVPIAFVPDAAGGGTSFHIDPRKIVDAG